MGLVSQFDAPLATFGGLERFAPATVNVGGFPVAVVVSPDGRSAYVLKAGKVVHYLINVATGWLSGKPRATVAAGSEPAAMAVASDERNAYVVNRGDNTVSQYSVDPTTGTLSAKTPATVPTGSGPLAVAVSPDGNSAYVLNNNNDPGPVSQYTVNASAREAKS